MKDLNKISTYSFRKTIASLAIFFLHYSLVYGQALEQIEAYFESDSIAVEKGSTFTNLLVIENSGTKEITIEDLAPQEKYPGLIFYPKDDFTLASGEQKRLPIKFIANLDFLKMPSDEITFTISFVTSSASKSLSTSFIIQKEEDKSISIQPIARENYIDPAATESTFSLFVQNRGYSARSLQLDFQSLPDGLEIIPRQLTLSLEGLEKRMVEIKVSTRKQNTLFPDYNIQVKATDLTDNEIVGSNNIQLVLLSHNRQIGRTISSGGSTNFAEIAFNEHSTGLNYLFLRGNTEFSAGENLYGRFNLTADYFLQDGRYNLYDTWLELENKNSTLRMGNVYGSDYDYSPSGRGVKLTTKIGSGDEFEALALENNYMLYGTYYPQGEGARMAGAKYSFGQPKTFNGKVSYLFDHDPRRSISSHVAHFVSSYNLHNKHHFGWEAGLSHEKGLINNDQNTGASAGFNYDTRFDKWDFQSLNSYATKSYAGLSRGSFNFIQRIGREFSGSTRAFIQYQNAQVEPEYLSFQSQPDYIYPGYFYSMRAIKTGYQFSSNNWNFLISPQVEKQKNTINLILHELLSYRLHANIGTSFGSHGLNLTTEYSYSKIDNDMDWFYGLRANMAYRYKNISLNSAVQWNPNSVIDLNSYYYNDGKDFVNYYLYTSYTFHAMKRSLTGSISAGAYYSELYENLNQNLAGNLEYKISSSWSATGYFNYSDYRSIETNGYSGSNYQFRIGLKKYFTVSTSIGNHKVRFLLFEDKNFNGILDIDEAVLPNEMVRLDNYVAVTDKMGRVTFQNVPEGSYKLKVNESVGSRLMMDPVIVVDKNINMNVGLVKKIKVTGKLIEVRQPYDDLETTATGLIVYARNKEGFIQTAVVNQENEFEFFLKDGIYVIYIENDKYNYDEPVKKIKVESSAISEVLFFEYSKKNKTIKVKKF